MARSANALKSRFAEIHLGGGFIGGGYR